MHVLGISCFYHDAAAAILRDGALVAAASEERFTRKKQDEGFPRRAIAFCLERAGIRAQELDLVVFYEKPLLKFERLLRTFIATFPRSLKTFHMAMPVWLKEKLWTPQIIRKELGYRGEILFSEHHLSHAASAFLVSPYEESAILTLDGVGEWACATRGVGRGGRIELRDEIHFPHSLGLLYSAFTYYLGFKVNSAEYKVMGLAPYGEPTYADAIRRNLVHVAPDGSFRLDLDYFAFHYGDRMTNRRFDDLFGGPPRDPEGALTQRHKDLARSVQVVTEEIVLALGRRLHEETRLPNLCMAGGVALNCVANGRLAREGPFENIFVQPAAGDAGGSVGAAFWAWNQVLGNPRRFVWPHAYWGPEWSDDECEEFLRRNGVPYRRLPERELVQAAAEAIERQKVVGWFQGRMEFGPRALGSRSILADARHEENRDRVNLAIKFRESFRPFAPSVLLEKSTDWFDMTAPDPYMLFVGPVRPERRIVPAITHVDHSARIQTVDAGTNPRYHALLAEFEKRTGVPLVINTSFNVRGEPIVCSPQDAYACFLATYMDVLVLGTCLLEKRPYEAPRDAQGKLVRPGPPGPSTCVDGRPFPELEQRRTFELD